MTKILPSTLSIFILIGMLNTTNVVEAKSVGALNNVDSKVVLKPKPGPKPHPNNRKFKSKPKTEYIDIPPVFDSLLHSLSVHTPIEKDRANTAFQGSGKINVPLAISSITSADAISIGAPIYLLHVVPSMVLSFAPSPSLPAVPASVLIRFVPLMASNFGPLGSFSVDPLSYPSLVSQSSAFGGSISVSLGSVSLFEVLPVLGSDAASAGASGTLGVLNSIVYPPLASVHAFNLTYNDPNVAESWGNLGNNGGKPSGKFNKNKKHNGRGNRSKPKRAHKKSFNGKKKSTLFTYRGKINLMQTPLVFNSLQIS